MPRSLPTSPHSGGCCSRTCSSDIINIARTSLPHFRTNRNVTCWHCGCTRQVQACICFCHQQMPIVFITLTAPVRRACMLPALSSLAAPFLVNARHRVGSTFEHDAEGRHPEKKQRLGLQSQFHPSIATLHMCAATYKHALMGMLIISHDCRVDTRHTVLHAMRSSTDTYSMADTCAVAEVRAHVRWHQPLHL